MEIERAGLGVMLGMLGGNQGTAEALVKATGKRISNVEIKPVKDEWEEPDTLVLTFDDGKALHLWDGGQSCCESRYITTDDDLTAHVGALFVGAEVRDGSATEGEYGDMHEIQFLHVGTSAGTMVLETHNEHNGYYGGFWVEARLADA